MKTLHLLRHAKSAWDEPGLADHQRGLNRRGRRDAPRMGEALTQRMAPLPVTASTARRAQLTLEGLCEGWPALAGMPHRSDETLYTFVAEELLAWLQEQPAEPAELFIIGHNPALTDLANALDKSARLANLPTAGYLQLALRIDRWRDIRQGCGRIVYRLFPRQL